MPNERSKRSVRSSQRNAGSQKRGRRRPRRAGSNPSGGGGNAASGSMSVSAVPYLKVQTLPLFPLSCRKTLTYYDNVSVTSSSVLGAQVYALNGLYDPDITNTGHQARGFDQIMLFYEHYVVETCLFEVVARSAANAPVNLGFSIRPDSTSSLNWRGMIENGDMEYIKLQPANIQGCFGRIKRKVKIAKLQGIPDIRSDPLFRGTNAANPTEMSYLYIVAYFPFSATSTIVELDVRITMTAWFTERAEPPESLAEKSAQMAASYQAYLAKKKARLEEKSFERLSLSDPPLKGDLESIDLGSNTKHGALCGSQLSIIDDEAERQNNQKPALESKNPAPIQQTSKGFLNNLLR